MPDSLGDRMKGYENVSRIYLTKRLPVIIRIDGRAFHSFTRGFARPFDELLHKVMWQTTKALCEQVGGTKLGYVQSDEISLLLINDDTISTEPWFGNNLQKLVSVSASIATMEFNRAFLREYSAFGEALEYAQGDIDEDGKQINLDEGATRLQAYEKAALLAQFDARAFVIPPGEVTNYFIWRQQDATRNSIQMVAQSLYSHGELQNKNTSDLQEMIFQKGVNWDNLPVRFKRGVCCVKDIAGATINLPDGTQKFIQKSVWMHDFAIPIFTQNREYIERFINAQE